MLQINSKLLKKDTYSTEEQIIGIWIDGKPIYRKVIIGINNTASSTRSIDVGLKNWNMLPMTSIGLTNSCSSVGYGGGNFGYRYEKDGDKINIITTDNDLWLGEYKIVLYYTKNN